MQKCIETSRISDHFSLCIYLFCFRVYIVVTKSINSKNKAYSNGNPKGSFWYVYIYACYVLVFALVLNLYAYVENRYSCLHRKLLVHSTSIVCIYGSSYAYPYTPVFVHERASLIILIVLLCAVVVVYLTVSERVIELVGRCGSMFS